ncbi:putative ribonuclease H-like domain-containing protein, partial [Tanacetum coccineum]
MKKMYCLVVTNDDSRFSWVFFLATKDETSGTEYKNKEMNQFCKRKGIKREFSVARTPQQNGVAERKNRTLIKAVKTMLADSKLPTTFWAEAVNTACHVQNRERISKKRTKNKAKTTKSDMECKSVLRGRIRAYLGSYTPVLSKEP